VLTIKQYREKAAVLEALYRSARSVEEAQTTDHRWQSMETEIKDSMMNAINGGGDNPVYLTSYGRSLILSLVGNDISAKEIAEHVKTNRLDSILKWAYLEAVNDATRNQDNSEAYGCVSVDMNSMTVTINIDGYITGHPKSDKPISQHPTVIILDIMYRAQITKENVAAARMRHVRQMAVFDTELKAQEGVGIAGVLAHRPQADKEIIKAQFAELEDKITNNLVARTWGFEIEIPDAKGVEAPAGVQKGDDGSLRSYNGSDDCECDCGDCSYHDCDCDWCDNRNTDPDHCGSESCADCDSAEYRTTGGVQRMQHAGMFKLCKELDEEGAELNDSAGTHIHVYAQDLTTRQVGQVLAAYTFLDHIIRPIAGRKNVNYAMEVPIKYIARALRKTEPQLSLDKPREVNTMHLFNGRGTIEFRQMDCNANAKRITAWAWLVRGFVTAAKRGATMSDYRKCKDLNDVVAVFKRFKIEPNNENPEQIIYGSKNDADLVAPFLKQHQRIDN
jgi:predicted DNA-binding protein YlxM (UPF0122 family)